MFTDQTEKVTREFQARQDRKNVSKSATETPAAGRNRPLSKTVLPRRRVPSQTSPSYALSMSIESVAQTFFFNTYAIVGPTCPHAAQHSLQGPAVDLLSITAVGMAGLANYKKDKGLMVLARAKYDSSLRLIKTALQNPAEASKEATIAAVFMMSMFEVLAT